MNDSLFKPMLKKLYENATKKVLTNLILEIYEDKHVSNSRMEKLLAYAYWNNKKLDYQRIFKTIKKDDSSYKMIRYYSGY
jgi:hypothetical protein